MGRTAAAPTGGGGPGVFCSSSEEELDLVLLGGEVGGKDGCEELNGRHFIHNVNY